MKATDRARGRTAAPTGRATLTIAVVLTTVLLSGCGGGGESSPPTTTSAKPTARASGLRGLVPTPLPRKADFTLTDARGHRFDFVSATKGKLTYLYFGYTHCPDVCPLTMANISAALRREPVAVRRKVAVIFVTVDPRRDTRPVLRAWLRRYGPSFVGLTGSRRQIGIAERLSGVPLAAPEQTNGGGYAVQHSAIVLAYSPDNRAHVVYAEGFTSADYAHDMPILQRFRAS